MLKYFLSTAFLAVNLSPAMASQADPDIEVEAIEELPNKKLERSGERISGPITAIRPAGLMFASFDKNTDYVVSFEEFSQGRKNAFKAADKDKSKSLSLFELEDWREKALGSLDAAPGNFAFDKDFDQRVTHIEFDRALDFIFTKTDKNKDEVIDFSELVNVFEMPRRPVIEERVDRLEELESQQRGNRNQRRR